MTIDYIHIAELIYKKQLEMSLTPEEEKKLEDWMKESEEHRQLYDEILNRPFDKSVFRNWETAGDAAASWKKIVRRSHDLSSRRISNLKFVRYAAVIFLLLAVGSLWLFFRQPEVSEPTLAENVIPGRKQAVLTLSDGRQVSLDEQMTLASITEEEGITIRNEGKNLQYDSCLRIQKELYNTIDVPRGGEYLLTLSDGTSIWLNSESRLTYPVSFSGDTREVSLKGEAFFEVKKNTGKPFIVHTGEFDVRVTGTQFNVRIYPDEPACATLAEGHIQLEKNQIIRVLEPGQQAVLVGNDLKIGTADIEEITAWRYENFCFNQRRLESIMNELTRWYDIEIFYQDAAAKEYHFTAWFKRSDSIEEVIMILEKTQKIKMELKGKTLTIKSK